MKIRLKNKRLYINLLLGIFWSILGVLRILDDQATRWMDFGFLFVALLYWGHFLYDLYTPYLTIENGTIRKNILYGWRKNIDIKEIDHIKKFGEEYILKGKSEKLRINTNLIKEESIRELDEFLQKLDLPNEKTSFHRMDNKKNSLKY